MRWTEEVERPMFEATRREVLWMLRRARSPVLRSMREFAESEIIIPDGPFKNLTFRCERQPFSRIWFDLAHDRRFNRKFAAGCTQSGKSLTCFVIPCLYHLFEMQETVICGVPDMGMAADKWREDLLPAIEHTRYRDLLPTKGAGSRGGTFDSITFANGVTLKFMSGGGGDKSRAGFTARVLCVTEVDGFDVTSDASREADKFTQLEARTLAYGENKCVYGECTVSIETGRIWTEWVNGTKTDLYPRCPHCQAYVEIGRDALIGWQDAATEEAARRASHFSCPSCGQAWSENDRRAANIAAVPVHRGQRIEGEQVVGEIPETRTMALRWHGGHNFFYDAGYMGAEEWNAARAVDEENAEKKLRQFLWTLPHVPATVDATPLAAHGIMGRMATWRREIVPPDTEHLTLGIDIGKFRCHWVLLAFRASGHVHVVDYGYLEPLSDQYGEERAIMAALVEFRDVIERGWLAQDDAASKGHTLRVPDQVWIDSRYQKDVVFQFVRDSGGDTFQACQGYGVEQRTGTYLRPRKLTKVVRAIGEEYHLSLDRASQVYVAEINADYWKSWVHARLAQEVREPGAMTLYADLPRVHQKFAKHLTAEKAVEEFIPGKGVLTKWKRVSRQNHWFDATYIASAAGHFCGFELVGGAPTPEAPVSDETD